MILRFGSLEDLYYYLESTNKDLQYRAENDNDRIIVYQPAKFQKVRTDYFAVSKDTEGLMPVTLQACHTELNVNRSFIAEDVMTAALPSFSNRPILGYIHEVNGEYHFYGHNMHLDGNGEIVYDEVAIGTIPESCNARLEYDEEKGKTYVVVDGYIYEEYTKAAEIMQREKECSVSVELSIRQLSYNAADKYMNIEDFYFSGVTILGKNEKGEDIKPGMTGSNVKIGDFDQHPVNTPTKEPTFAEQFRELFQKCMTEAMKDINPLNSTKGGNNQMFEELLIKYNKTVDDITFEYEGMSDTELEEAFAKAFDESVTVEYPVLEPGNDPQPDDNDEPVQDPEPEVFQKIFQISHDDIRYALYNLLSDFENSDNEWYWINAVYDDHFVYEGWSNNKVWGQKYTVENDNVSFDGERYELFKELLTASEKAELDSMRANYSSIQSQLSEYQKKEETTKKKELMASSDYQIISNSEDFILLSKSVNEETDNMTFTALKEKCDEMLLNYAKSGKFSFAVNSEHSKNTSVRFPEVQEKSKSRYGSLKFN